MKEALNNPVVLFDGVCNLCSATVRFLIRHDPKKKLHFASLQSSFGKKILQQFGLESTRLNSFIFLENERIYTSSAGALRLTRYLNHLWPLLTILYIIPPFIRNGVYRWISRNRYKWFGKKEVCWTPAPELKDLFIED